MKRKQRNRQKTPSRSRQHHYDPQRQVWRQILLDIGMRAADLDVKRVSPDLLSDAAERAGFSPELIAEILRVHCDGAAPGSATPDRELPPPATSLTRESRVELMEQRIAAGQAPIHPDDVTPDDLDDHVVQLPEGKPRAHWFDEELAAEHEEQEQADDLARFDVVPRRLMREWEERRRQRQRSRDDGHSGGSAGENDCKAILGAA